MPVGPIALNWSPSLKRPLAKIIYSKFIKYSQYKNFPVTKTCFCDYLLFKDWLVVFYHMSTLVGYLMPNPIYVSNINDF